VPAYERGPGWLYWFPLFELLESRGFTVLLVNARHVKNISGRKSDVLDCQWLQQPITYGLLSGAFLPAEQVCVLRSLWRQRAMLLRGQGRDVWHMQKALTQMNIQLAQGKRHRAKNAPKFDLRPQLFNTCGVGLTRIDGELLFAFALTEPGAGTDAAAGRAAAGSMASRCSWFPAAAPDCIWACCRKPGTTACPVGMSEPTTCCCGPGRRACKDAQAVRASAGKFPGHRTYAGGHATIIG
jgi:hypothetical protein